MDTHDTRGRVYLTGAGPGDPGLLTLKGKACIEQADVVVYDYLAAKSLLAFARPDAEKIYVGKKGGDHTLSQDGINQLLVDKASQGLTVTRLKGGDPFIFGRGGEEIEILVKAGIPFEVVPGVTSPIAAAAYAGIPLTHRQYTATVAFVTGHERPDKETSNIDWDALVGMGTLVFLMGVKNLPNIQTELLKRGKKSDTPVALIQWGTTTRQRTVTGTLDTIVDDVKAAGLTSPAIILIGEVVNLRDSMSWFENRPLFGKRILVTRSRHQASDLVTRLAALGAECIEAPTIDVVPIADMAPLDTAIHGLSDYSWIVFTSVNGVDMFFSRLTALGFDVRQLHHINTACIGPSTANQLKKYGLKSDIIPQSYRAESVVEAFRDQAVSGANILIPRAREARPVLPVELRALGAHVDEVPVYETRIADASKETLAQALEAGDVDLVTFTSSSTATNFMTLIPDAFSEDTDRLPAFASIGPITTETAEKLGLSVAVTAETYTIPGLVDAIIRYFSESNIR
ncbi:MAG: uroporphyrinogen-III C-methyltransferase [Deltaproteobacteria bacterium]|nr:MAG: uroporphyrinogen-III C-methyltransferase [Deltaproteobacteria bacterium]